MKRKIKALECKCAELQEQLNASAAAAVVTQGSLQVSVVKEKSRDEKPRAAVGSSNTQAEDTQRRGNHSTLAAIQATAVVLWWLCACVVSLGKWCRNSSR